MQEVILIKCGELALKGLNRSTFEQMLMKNIRKKLSSIGAVKVKSAQSTIYVTPQYDDFDMDEASDRISKIFGIAAFTRACVCKKDMQDILKCINEYSKEDLLNASTFKVNAKRSDKSFEYKSPDICAMAGESILNNFPHLTVDVHNPDTIVTVEIRDFGAYIHSSQIQGAGGMPVGSSGRAMLLISGGIDSPVAGYMMAKRGIALTAVHFASPPYTSERSEMKVHDLLKQVSQYAGSIALFTVPFTKIQEAIRDNCQEEYSTLIMRRLMMKIATKLAHRQRCDALITGESLGQVASQTMLALGCTDDAAGLPVFRPCIGMDKDEIIAVSRKIDTFDISIQPFDDCCTVFTPRHPRTRPKLEDVIKIESAVDWQPMIMDAIENTNKIVIE